MQPIKQFYIADVLWNTHRPSMLYSSSTFEKHLNKFFWNQIWNTLGSKMFAVQVHAVFVLITKAGLPHRTAVTVLQITQVKTTLIHSKSHEKVTGRQQNKFKFRASERAWSNVKVIGANTWQMIDSVRHFVLITFTWMKTVLVGSQGLRRPNIRRTDATLKAIRCFLIV